MQDQKYNINFILISILLLMSTYFNFVYFNLAHQSLIENGTLKAEKYYCEISKK